MAIRPILLIPDPKLRRASEPVAAVDDGVRALMDDMLETMYDAPGIGLAAVQIGVLKRVVVLDPAKKDEPREPMFFVNPEVVEASDERSVYEEGCLSIPEYYEEVERPARVKVRYLDRQGARQEIDAEGIFATALQHEIDHLNGVLFIDYLSRLKRERVVKKFSKAAKREADPPSARGEALTADGTAPMRVVFMGTPAFSVPVLEAIIAQGHDVVAVYTRAARAAGRGMALRPSPVQRLADAHKIDVVTPASLRSDEAAAAFRSHRADVAVVVAYGLLLPQAILDAPRFGCLNLHASLLPRWRGAAPIQRAIMAGDSETGVMVMQMEAALDTGPVALTAEVPIEPETTAGELHDRLSQEGAALAPRAMDGLRDGTLTFVPQPSEGIVYAQKIDKFEARIDWTRPAARLHDHVRGLSPFPGAYFEADLGRGQPERIKVLGARRVDAGGSPGTILDDALTVACGEGAIRLESVQRAGKAPMTAAAFLRGTRLDAGTRLG